MEFLTKNTFLANYISFCKGHNPLKNYQILTGFFQNVQEDMIKFFCSLNIAYLLTVEEIIAKNYIFGGHFAFMPLRVKETDWRKTMKYNVEFFC